MRMVRKKSDSSKDKGKAKRVEAQEIELDPDAWPKFEALVKSAAKMGHKPQKGGKKS